MAKHNADSVETMRMIVIHGVPVGTVGDDDEPVLFEELKERELAALRKALTEDPNEIPKMWRKVLTKVEQLLGAA